MKERVHTGGGSWTPTPRVAASWHSGKWEGVSESGEQNCGGQEGKVSSA